MATTTTNIGMDNFSDELTHRARHLLPGLSIFQRLLRLPLFVVYVGFGLLPVVGMTVLEMVFFRSSKRVQQEASKTAYLVARARHVLYLTGLGSDHIAGLFVSPIHRFIDNVLAMYPWFTGGFKFMGWLSWLTSMMMIRTEIGDALVRKFVLKEGGRQIVSLGAGLDARAYRMDCLTSGKTEPPLKYFEVDVAPSQEMKLRVLRENNIKNTHVTYVPVDFSVETFTDCLKRNGWREDERTLFLWEGVTGYLPEEAVFDAFRAFGKCAKGTLIYFNAAETKVQSRGDSLFRAYLASVGEPKKWSLPDTSDAGISKLLEPFGLELVKHVNAVEAWNFFLRRDDGTLASPLAGGQHWIIARVPEN